ncbi:c Gal-specific lectin [Paramuricea clavata]|uniref:C Gal-specific lectin n=1 Tax=Paramuricea clavata TaxID=317549 RepID=A0A6S7GZP7_PARCT|nr:c Gal-specific lectin [Paramuricea clavata]
MAGPIGYLFHRSSGKLVHPKGGSSDPGNNTSLVLYDDRSNAGRLQVRFVPAEGSGHFGYIQHVSSGKIVHPQDGRLDCGENTHLVYHSDRHGGALFAFNEGERIVHKGGKIWHPEGGALNPGNDTLCLLHSDAHHAAKFYFGDLNGTKMSPYPDPSLSGSWEMVKAFISHDFVI